MCTGDLLATVTARRLDLNPRAHGVFRALGRGGIGAYQQTLEFLRHARDLRLGIGLLPDVPGGELGHAGKSGSTTRLSASLMRADSVRACRNDAEHFVGGLANFHIRCLIGGMGYAAKNQGAIGNKLAHVAAKSPASLLPWSFLLAIGFFCVARIQVFQINRSRTPRTPSTWRMISRIRRACFSLFDKAGQDHLPLPRFRR